MYILDSYKLIGPNRRSEKTVIEVWLQFSSNDVKALQAEHDKAVQAVTDLLKAKGITTGFAPANELSGTRAYADWLGRVSLAIQQHAGHRVSFHETYPGLDSTGSVLAVEFEHGDAGMESVRIAMACLGEAVPAVKLDDEESIMSGRLEDELAAYFKEAPSQVLPRLTQDIIDAANQRDIPWVKLERDPYSGLEGDFRIRINSMLKLGHACYQRVIDGTFPIDSNPNLAQLVHDRAAVQSALNSLGAPLAPGQVCNSTAQATTVAEQIAYPVILKPRRINRSQTWGMVSGPLQSKEQVEASAEMAIQSCGGVILEKFVPGKSYKALLANQTLVGFFELENGRAIRECSEQIHESLQQWLTAVATRMGTPLLTLTMVSTDITRPFPQIGTVTSLDAAPQIDDFLPYDGDLDVADLRRQAANGLIEHLFPGDQRTRVPLISVTGTNGKSTVCTMIASIMQQHGYSVGQAGTTGIYIGGELQEFGDFSGGMGHHRILESTAVNLAVLETARGAASGLGLSFDHSDISVCTNVSADHLSERGIDTVPKMAELKQFIVNRARKTVVLNADNEFSVGMLPDLTGRQVWIVSELTDVETLRAHYGNHLNYCTTDQIEDEEWISLHDETASVPLIKVNDIPATMEGIARFNVVNAMQAIAASFAAGASVQNIKEALSAHTNNYNHIPGRLNFYDELPFRVLFDFAHNDESHRALRQVVDVQEVKGRKILCFSRRDDTSDEDILGLTAVVAEGYDFFVCYENPFEYWREPFEVPPILRQGLINNGVSEENILMADTDDALLSALNACREGDLLVYCASTKHMERDWQQLINHKPKNSG